MPTGEHVKLLSDAPTAVRSGEWCPSEKVRPSMFLQHQDLREARWPRPHHHHQNPLCKKNFYIKKKRKPLEVGQVHKNIGVVVKPHRWPAAHNFARHALQEDDQAFAPSHGQRITFGRVGAHPAQYSTALVACTCDLAWHTFWLKGQTLLCSTTAKVLRRTTANLLTNTTARMLRNTTLLPDAGHCAVTRF